MIKKSTLFLLFLILGIITTSTLLFLRYEWEIQKDILYLKDTRIIISEETTDGEKLVYYRQDGITKVLPKEDVEYIGYGDATETTNGEKYLSCYASLAKEKIKNLIQSDKTDANRIQDGFAKISKKNLSWLSLLILIPVVYLVVRRRFTDNKKQEKKISNEKKSRESGVAVQKKKEEEQDISDTLQIARFFLDLFRLQTGAAPDAPSELFPVEARTIGSNRIYQLRILHNGEWVKRRMSIGPLGEESGSKSKCFYVIYDVHMVIKIPPKPLNDFQGYIDSIKSDGHIVDKLAPKQCIIPKISVILQRVYTFPGGDNITPEKLEEKYIRLLEKRPALQEYLKIGGSFVFFMDLSKYFFLGHILDNLHDLGQKVNEEILRNPGIIWDLQGFSGRYGLSTAKICDKMQEIHTDFETEIRNRLMAQDPPVPVLPYQIKNWYLLYLAGNTIKPDEKLVSPVLADHIDKLADELFQRNAKEIALYKKVVHKYVRNISFAQSRSQLENISINLLTLLSWLGEKKIAMRDLKPDNLLVAGEPTEYPQFLTSVEKFSIGLIDVETAVDYDDSNERKIPQPQLGGTPNYATPTHLFDNRTLSLVYHNLPRILHLQDWQATIGMIYKTTMGKTLFQNTGKLLPNIVKTIHQAVANRKKPEPIIQEISRMFWRRAAEDFTTRIHKNASDLQSLKLKLPETVKTLFRREVFQTNQELINTIQQYIQSQTAFSGDQDCQQLITAPYKQILALKSKRKEQNGSLPQDKAEQLKVLQALEHLKYHNMVLQDFLSRLDEPYAKLTVYDILSLMFTVVYNTMHKPEWESFSPETGWLKKGEKNGI
ncbi:MAG: hypothetical protein ABIK15_10140 [Pseudomonadota bacterium]